jgi:thiamine transport system substrate-binding protein
MPRLARRLTLSTCATLTAASLALSGCSLAGKEKNPQGTGTEAVTTAAPVPGSTVTLVTHGDFALPAEVLAKFESDTGLKLEVRKIEDGLPNQLALTKDHPLGDVAYGVDNGSAAFDLQQGVFADYQAKLPDGAKQYLLEGAADKDMLTPIDHGAVCVNVDLTWFAQHKIDPPATLEDLTLPKYKDLLALPGATGSTTGLLFLLATMDQYDDAWPAYWSRLVGNGADIAKDWSDAYYGDFTAGGGSGKRPMVVSYDTSPAFTVDKKTGESTTAALLDTCIQQVEYAGILANAKNPAGARELVDFLVSPEVQAALPDSMYMFPVAAGTPLPDAWARHAHQPSRVFTFDADELAKHRQEWLAEWRDVTTR